MDATALSDATDMGILKSHIFSGWKQKDLAQIIVGRMETDPTLCSRNWRITREDMAGGGGGRALAAKDTANRFTAQAGHSLGARMRHLLTRASQPLRYALNDRVMCRASMVDDPNLMNWVRDFSPDVVFTFGASATICKMASQISEAQDVPVLPFFTDDWASWLYSRAPMRQVARRSLTQWFGRMMERAPLRLTICETMASAYAMRYGGRFATCMDSVDLTRYPRELVEASGSRAAVTFAFAGVLAPKRWKPLKWAAEAAEALRRAGRECRFHVYTMPPDVERFSKEFHLSDQVRIVGTVPFASVPGIHMAADVLVHAEGFLAGNDIAKTSLSLSTKIPQYLAAGRPILAIGPPGIASIEYLRATGAAVVVDQPDPDLVARAVEQLIDDGEARVRMGLRARQVCEKYHTRSSMNACFAQAVEEAVQMYREGKSD